MLQVDSSSGVSAEGAASDAEASEASDAESSGTPAVGMDLPEPSIDEETSSDGAGAAVKKAAPRKAPAKKAAAKKAPAKKATTKKAPEKKTAAKKATAKKAVEKTSAVISPKYPRHSLDRALRIPTAIYDQNGGKPATRLEAVKYAGGAALTGEWNVEISSAIKYGLLESEGQGKIGLTERGRRAIAPQSEMDRTNALREAVTESRDISAVYTYYRGEQLPDAQ